MILKVCKDGTLLDQNQGSSYPYRFDLFFRIYGQTSEMLIEKCTYEREQSLFYTDTGVVLSVMVWNCVGDEPCGYIHRYKLEHEYKLI